MRDLLTQHFTGICVEKMWTCVDLCGVCVEVADSTFFFLDLPKHVFPNTPSYTTNVYVLAL